MITQDELENIFTYHSPKPEQLKAYKELRAEAKVFAEYVVNLCPESREKSLAITKIQEAVMFANAAIAIHS